MKDTSLLRTLISEILKISVSRINDDGSEQGPPIIRRVVDDELEDEIIWVVDKYERPAFEKRVGKVPSPKTGRMINDPSGKKVWTTDSMDQFESVVQELAYIGLPPPSPPLDADRLFKVVEPWGQVGFDVLRRILIATRRTREPFPFFMYELNAETDTPIPIPNSPAKETIDFIISSNTRIGRNTTGKGELLLALLTGGIAGSPVGDLEISGQYFELKDIRAGAVRAGDVTSVKFDSLLKDWFKTKWQSAPDFNNSYETFIPALKTGESYAAFLSKYPDAEDEINAITQEALEEEKMKYVLLRDNDFVFMEPKMFKFVSFPRRLNVIASNDALPGTTAKKKTAKLPRKKED